MIKRFVSLITRVNCTDLIWVVSSYFQVKLPFFWCSKKKYFSKNKIQMNTSWHQFNVVFSDTAEGDSHKRVFMSLFQSRMKTILLTSDYCTVHYITVPSCMCLCTWAACLIEEFKTVWKVVLRLEVENISFFPITLSFVDEVYQLLCRSASHQGQVIPLICFKMPWVLTVLLAFATRKPWMPSGVFLLSVQMTLGELSKYKALFLSISVTQIYIKWPFGNVFLHISRVSLVSHSESCYSSFNLDMGHGSCLQHIMNTESVSFPNTLLRPPLVMTASMVHDVMFN